MNKKYDMDRNGGIDRKELACFAERMILEGKVEGKGGEGLSKEANRSDECK
jgi:hypothetical protein